MSARDARRRLSRQERRESILAAAAEAFAETGYGATSMEDIASRAGVSKVLLYRHTEGKAELYRAVLDDVLAAMGTEFDTRVSAGEENGAIRAVLSVAKHKPHGVRLLVRRASREADFAAHVEELRARVVDDLTPLVKANVDGDDDVIRWVIELGVTIVWEGVVDWLDHGGDDDEEIVARLGAAVQALVSSGS